MGFINVNKMYFKKQVKMSPFFHYTSPEAFKNIIEKSSIRFTHCAFLNDTEEYMYIDEVIKEIVDEKKDKKVSEFISSMREDLDHDYKGIVLKPGPQKWFLPSMGEYYVLSGTSEKDSLPMWNYYVKSESYLGYAIKLDVKELYELINPFLPIAGEFIVGKVIYEKDVQKDIIIEYTRYLFDKHNRDIKEEREDVAILDLQDAFFDFIQRTRLFFKREGFKHEKELRVVVLADTDISKKGFDTGFNVTKGIIKPYIEYSFPVERLPIKQVILSPSIEETVGRLGVETLLKKYNYSGIPIEKSELRLRF